MHLRSIIELVLEAERRRVLHELAESRTRVGKPPRRQFDRQSLEPREAIVADVTGDGKKDLLLLVHDRVLIYPQSSSE